ncbi:hypothetical protein [Micromonospora rubida]|uniref:hypothetical protein n=1 Tax=Micromonospora rubida TaxID=2697657 RepID=UPI001378CFF7|nr:hypothetical protein [Micromonospora rubida]NBE84926.1 hypothetical protein [Micromonospora rubida]
MVDSTARSESGLLHLSDLAREVIEAAAPEEAGLLPEVSAAWLAGDLAAGPGRRGRRRGAAIGLGLDAPLLVTVVYPVLAAALTSLVVPAAERGWRRLSDRWRRPRRRTDVVIPRELVEQAETVRDAILASAPGAGVSRRRAAVLAEAAYAALIRRQFGGDR